MRLQRWALTICSVCLLGIAGCATIAAQMDDAIAAHGRGDNAQALKIFRSLASQGNAPAQHNLGYMYYNGKGVTQDHQEALKWYRLAAAQGDASAQNSLGWMYHKGQGVTQNYQEAVKWLRRAAAQGNSEAQSNLGYMYFNGYGVTQDHQEALKLFRLAAAQGQPNAIENLKLPGMVVAAQQQQQTYQPQQPYQPTPQPKSESKTDMTSAMGKCSELGFKKGTEKFGDCVLKLSK